jgi:hypothetical protein
MILFRLRTEDVLPRYLIGKRKMSKTIEMTPTKSGREKEKLHDDEMSSYNTLESDNISIVNLS